MGFGQTSLSGVRRGFMPPQLKTKTSILPRFLFIFKKLSGFDVENKNGFVILATKSELKLFLL